MSPAEIKAALQEVVGPGVSLTASTWITLVSLWILSTAAAAFFGRYFGKRGETAAIQTDLDKIKTQLEQTTKVAEEIKAQIGGELWLKQRRWDMKWKCYSDMIENLGELEVVIREWMALSGDSELPSSEKESKKQRIAVSAETYRRSASIARIVVGPGVRQRLSAFADEWGEAKGNVPGQYQALRKAWLEITDAARVDLFGDPSEYPDPVNEPPPSS